MPGNCCASLVRCSSQGSTICRALAGWPWRIRPPTMALAMLPPPMKVMVGWVGVFMAPLSRAATRTLQGATVWRTACSHCAIFSAASFARQLGLKGALGAPLLREFVQPGVQAGVQAGQVGRAQRGGFDHGRPHHRDAQQVGLELHQQVVDAGAAVHPQFAHRHAAGGHRVAAHGGEQGGALEGDALQRGARDVGHGGAAREAGEAAAAVGLPVGRAQAGEGGHQHHAAGVGHALGQRLHLAAGLDGAAGRRAATAPPRRR